MWSLTRPFRPPWQPFEHHSYDGRRCPCGWCKRDSAVASQSVMMAARSGTRSTEDLVRRVFRGRPFTMLDAQGHGLTRAQVRAAISAGRFTPLRRGVVIATADLQAMSLQARHLAVAHAQLLVRNADSVLSHHSARVLHSLPSPVPDEAIPASVFITCSMTGARSFGVTVVRAELTAEDISLVGRLRATSIPGPPSTRAEGKRWLARWSFSMLPSADQVSTAMTSVPHWPDRRIGGTRRRWFGQLTSPATFPRAPWSRHHAGYSSKRVCRHPNFRSGSLVMTVEAIELTWRGPSTESSVRRMDGANTPTSPTCAKRSSVRTLCALPDGRSCDGPPTKCGATLIP